MFEYVEITQCRV